MPDLFEKLSLMSCVDEKGKYWEIVPTSASMHIVLENERLREGDLEQLAEWIARELRWIPPIKEG